MQTPKEKAIELVEKFRNKTATITKDSENDISIIEDVKTVKSATKDAIIAVEEIIKVAFTQAYYKTIANDIVDEIHTKKYWNEVLTELKTML